MNKFPSRKKLAVTASNTNPKQWSNALAFLSARSGDLALIESAEELVFRNETGNAALNGHCHHLGALTGALVVALRREGVIVGASVIEEMLFQNFRAKSPDPVGACIDVIHRAGLHHDGLLIYPLHSFGVAGLSMRMLFTDDVLTFMLPDLGVAVSPQTNSWERTREFIQGAASALDVPRKIPWDMIEHWTRARPVSWLKTNPLAIIRVSNFPGTFYENTRYLVQSLNLAAGSVHLAFAVQQSASVDSERCNFSTARMNNYETLDVKHFLSLFPDATNKSWLTGDCIPFHASPAALADLCDWSIDVDPIQWRRRTRTLTRIVAAVGHLSRGLRRYSSHGYGDGNSPADRFYRKSMQAVTHFRRSYQRSSLPMDRVVSLATAFEALLTDHYAGGIKSRLVQRAAVLIRGTRGTRALQESVGKVYTARCEILHEGRVASAREALPLAQKCFALCFLRLMELAAKYGTPAQGNAIEELLRHA